MINQINQLIGAILTHGRYSQTRGSFNYTVDYNNRYSLTYGEFDRTYALHGVIGGQFFFIEFEGDPDLLFRVYETEYEGQS